MIFVACCPIPMLNGDGLLISVNPNGASSQGRNAIVLKSSAAATVADDDGDMTVSQLARSPRHRLASSSVCISLCLSLGMDCKRCSEICIFGYDSSLGSRLTIGHDPHWY